MPKTKSYKKKKTYKRRRNGRGPHSIVPAYSNTTENLRRPTSWVLRGITGVPDRTRVPLKMKTIINSGSVATSVHVFRTNSIFDPDLTGGGLQPRYHDQWAAMYNKYRVNGFAWRLTCVSTGGLGCWWARANSDLQFTGTYLTVAEHRHGKSIGYTGPTSSGNVQIMDQGYVDLRAIHGQYQLNDDQEALFGANPVDQTFFYVVRNSEDDGGTATTSSFQLEATFYCEFFEPTVPLFS